MIQDARHVLVDGVDTAQVVPHVPLVLPPRPLMGPVGTFEFWWRRFLHVDLGQIIGDAHRDPLGRLAQPSPRVEERLRLGNGTDWVEIVVLGVGQPRSVGCLVVDHQGERPRSIPARHPVQSQVGDDIGCVPGHPAFAVRADHDGIEVLALPRKDQPLVETAGLRLLRLAEVPLPEEGRLVAGLVQYVDIGRHPVVELGEDTRDAVHVAVRPGQDRRPRGRTDRVRAERRAEERSFAGDAVDGWCLVDHAVVCRDRMWCVVVGQDEHEVGARSRVRGHLSSFLHFRGLRDVTVFSGPREH